MTIKHPYICTYIYCMRIIKITLFILLGTVSMAQPLKISSEQYIIKYKDFAIAEMYRCGVPASITLAQGILESQSGNSRLARDGNNHFGIKCKSTWTGKTIIADDDAVGECFRAYNSDLESFKDHSNFLRENWRYTECFTLDKTDYMGWAEGLKKAGYATNPKYNTLITGIISRYNLHHYDLLPKPDGVTSEYDQKNNDIPLVYAQAGETMDLIASRNELNSKQIYRYNDLPKGTQIEPGDIIYLKPKRRRGSEPYHIVQDGEDLYAISQQYGLKLKQLYKNNHLENGEEAVAGAKLYLQNKSANKPATITRTEFERIELEKKNSPLNVNNPEIKKIQPQLIPEPTVILKDLPKEEGIGSKEFHIIQNGDNLYRISEKHHVFVEDILDWNAIGSPEEIKVGDKLYLSKDAALKSGRYKTTTVKKENAKPIPKSKTYTVLKGDTAYKICKLHGINSKQLLAWNNLKDIDSIREGQKLKVGE